MKVLVITDLEGVAGVNRWNQTRDPEATKEAKALAMKLLTWEVNAAVDGILSAEPDAEVIVWDGHGSGGLDYLDLHRDAKYIPVGSPLLPPFFVDSSLDALFFVGQHAMAGTPEAPLCHSFNSRMVDSMRINGVLVGEFGTWAVGAGSFGVPAAFVSGDDKAVAEAKALVPNIVGAVVKWGLGIEMAIHLSAKAAQETICEHAALAMRNLPDVKPLRFEKPFVREIRVSANASIADYLKRGAEKVDERTVRIESDDFNVLMSI